MNYPKTPVRNADVTFGSVSFTDPYQYLEEAGADCTAWEAAQDRLTQDYLRSLPAYQPILKQLEEQPVLSLEFPVHAGGRWFRSSTPKGKDLKVVEVADNEHGPWRCVLDLNAIKADEPLSLDFMLPSPNGKKLLYIWSRGGREAENPVIVDVDTGAVLFDGIKQIRSMFHAWMPDSNGIYYSAYDPAVSMTHCQVYRQILGADPVTVAEPFAPTHPVVWARPTADKMHTLLIADHLCPRPDYLRNERDGTWRPFLKGMTGLFKGDIIGDRFFAITDDGAPRGRLVAIPLATPRDRASWKELVPGSDNVLASVLIVNDRVVVLELADLVSRIRVFNASGQDEGEVGVPGPGTCAMQNASVFNMADVFSRGPKDEVFFPWSSPTQSPAMYRFRVGKRIARPLTAPAVHFESRSQLLHCTSADGARVPYHVFSKPGLDLSQPKPTLITAYGAFNVATLPGWGGGYMASWIRMGGVLVIAYIRGGGELGPQQWHQGRLQYKQNGFNDLFAISEDMTKRGMASPETIGFIGGSNGGTVAATIAVQRPDLFRACVPLVPVTDPLARIRDPITMAATLDFGDPTDPDLSKVLFSWSPYHNIKKGSRYPAILVESGANDPRCPSWHGRKFVARLQAANAGPHPQLLRVRAGAGHGAVGMAAQRAQQSEWLAFLAEHLGLQVTA